jgi:hypothetical protein
LVDAGEISFSLARGEYLNEAVTNVAGGYYGYEIKAMEGRGGIKRIDPFSDLVYTFWDLGGIKEDSDTTAILFAHVDILGKTAKVVDYYENTGNRRGHYFDILKQKGYRYAGHYFPHDAKRSNEWTGETTGDTAYNIYGIEVRYIPKTNNVLNDIEIVRRGFASTSMDIDRCDGLLMHLSGYHEKETAEKPCHQNNCRECHGASHGADTFRALRMAMHLGLVEPYLRETVDIHLPWMNDNVDLEEPFLA